MSFTYQALVEDVGDGMSPTSYSINLTQGSSSRKWFALSNVNEDGTVQFNVQPSDILQLIHDVLGTTAYPVNTTTPGKLNRTLPLVDPLLPWLYASDIPTMQGFGQFKYTDTTSTQGGPSWPQFALWSNYSFTVNHISRPYPIVPDTSITSHQVNWTDTAGNLQHATYFDEWNRYTDFTLTPRGEWLEQQRGASYFQTNTGNEPGQNAQATTQQSVRMLMPDSILKILWVGVPLRYVLSTNSYLNRMRGYINQNAWEGPAGTGTPYPAGSLLYMDFAPRIYSPTVPVSITWAGSFLDYSKLCDIEMIFFLTSRVGTDLPAPANANFIAAGWNCLPYLPRRKFYYTYNLDLAGATKYPQFYSVPFELLFSDPDSPNGFAGAF